MRAAATTVVAGLIVVSCGLGAPQPSMAIPLRDGEWTLYVFDTTGLVQSGTPVDYRPGSAASEGVAMPEPMELEIRWVGGACSHGPTLKVAGDSTDLRLELRVAPPEWRLPFLSCPAVGVPLGVELSLRAPVARHAIHLEVRQ